MSNNQTQAELFNRKAHNPSFSSLQSEGQFQGELVDFCVPVNPYFPPKQLIDEINENFLDIVKYYPDYSSVHEANLANFIGIPAEHIVAANGSTELITLLAQHFKAPFLSPIPTFGRWTDLPFELDKETLFFQREEGSRFHINPEDLVARCLEKKVNTLVICNPNNPTGAIFSPNEIEFILKSLPHIRIIIDESFIDFSGQESCAEMIINYPNGILVKSLGKAVGWHGIRLGYAIAEPNLAAEIRNLIPYWNINGLAAFVLKQLPQYKKEYKQSFESIAKDRDYMFDRLSTIEQITVYPSAANFLFVKLPSHVSGKQLRNRLLKEYGLFIRECSNKIGSSESYLRLAVKTKSYADKLLEALKDCMPD